MKALSLTLSAVCLLAAARMAAAGMPVYVMLQLNTVNPDHTLAYPEALNQQLATLAENGVTGVMSDMWWGIVESDGPKQYNWTAYESMLNMVKANGLKFQAVMSFHRCGGNVGDACNIPLPSWVLDVGNSNPDIFYKDSSGHYDQEYLSGFIDNEKLFAGRSPLDMYADYMASFKKTFAHFLGDTITQVQISCGPSGELRYPSYQSAYWKFCGVGEFQCYDKYALTDLASAAAAAGHSDWGHGGPDNAGSYDSTPSNAAFFSSSGDNNYASDYGQFFLNWYSSALIAHGDRVLSIAASTFSGTGANIAAKVAGIHWWYKTDSHAAELTAGYFNTDGRDGYKPIAAMFAKHGVHMDFTCLEMLDDQQPADCDCGPFELVRQTKQAAHEAGIAYGGENALARYDQLAYTTIEQQASYLMPLDAFTYLRLGTTLLESNNLATFAKFVKAMANEN